MLALAGHVLTAPSRWLNHAVALICWNSHRRAAVSVTPVVPTTPSIVSDPLA
jgi:hypothetical protein